MNKSIQSIGLIMNFFQLRIEFVTNICWLIWFINFINRFYFPLYQPNLWSAKSPLLAWSQHLQRDLAERKICKRSHPHPFLLPLCLWSFAYFQPENFPTPKTARLKPTVQAFCSHSHWFAPSGYLLQPLTWCTWFFMPDENTWPWVRFWVQRDSSVDSL